MTRRINHTVLITAACFAAVFSCPPSKAQSEIFHGGQPGIWGDFDRHEVLSSGISKHSWSRLIIYDKLHSANRATVWVRDIFNSPDSHKNKVCEIVGYLVIKPDDIRLYETEEKCKKNQDSGYLKVKYASFKSSKQDSEPTPVEGNVFAMTAEERAARDIRTLPGSLGEALAIAEDSSLLRETLGVQTFSSFIKNKKIEWDQYRSCLLYTSPSPRD